MDITNRSEHDPVADLHIVDAYMRWALLAAEEVVGEKGLVVVLRDAGLERLIDKLPPEELAASGNLTFGDYAALNTGLLNFFGRAGKSMLLRAGRLAALHGISQQGALFGIAAAVASRILPIPTQLNLGLERMQDGFRKIMDGMRLSIEDRGDKLAYISETCPMCAGKHADAPICWLWTGSLQESIRWQTGKEFEIVEVECRATGAPACVWEISKAPKG